MNILYKEELLEHYHAPQNFGALESFSATSRQLNPFCGDEIEMFVHFKNDSINDISFQGKGCAISIAAGSLLTEYVRGKTKKQLTKFSQDDMLSLLGVEVSEIRRKCALLALGVLKDCL